MGFIRQVGYFAYFFFNNFFKRLCFINLATLTMRGLGLLFVMVMVNSEHHSKNAAGLPNSAGKASGTQAVTIIGHSYTVFMKPGKMFVLVQEKVTWDEARIQCQARLGDLAVLPTFKEIDLVTKTIGHLFGWAEGPWIGAQCPHYTAHQNDDAPHKFAWISGEAIAQDFGYWAAHGSDPGYAVALMITGWERKSEAFYGVEDSTLITFNPDEKREGYLCEIN